MKKPRFIKRSLYGRTPSSPWRSMLPALGLVITSFAVYVTLLRSEAGDVLQGSVFSETEGGLTRPKQPQGTASTRSLLRLIVEFTNFILPYIVVLAVLALVYGGILFVTAGGQQDKVDQGKKIVFWSAVGLLLAIASYSIVNTIVEFN